MQLAWQGCGPGCGNGWERLCTALRRLTWFQLSSLGPLVRTTAIAAVPGEEFQNSVRQIIEKNGRQVSNTIVDGMMDGSIRPCDPVLASHFLGGTIDHAAGVVAWAPSVTTDNIVDKFLKPTLFGLIDPVL
jgi:hypothetical protein